MKHFKYLMNIFLIVIPVFMTGCAQVVSDLNYSESISTVETLIVKNKYNEAYERLNKLINSDNPAYKSTAVSYFIENKYLYKTAASHLEYEYIKYIQEVTGENTGLNLTKLKLQSFKLFAKNEDYFVASQAYDRVLEESNLKKQVAFEKKSIGGSDIYITKNIWNDIDFETRSRILVELPEINILPTNKIGLITAIDTQNLSSNGTTTGAIFGTAIGQAQYIDNSSLDSYSGTNQVISGVIGGVIGSLVDTPRQVKFSNNFTFKLNDGSVVSFKKESPAHPTLSIGQCIKLDTFNILNNNACIESKPAFLKLISKRLIKSTSDDLVYVNCSIPGLGIAKLNNPDECTTSGGRVN